MRSDANLFNNSYCLGGLISVSGSASFFRESSVLENEETFNMAFISTSHSDVLPKNTPKDFVNECNNKEATHVVSSITYGKNGYFHFKHNLKDSNESQKVGGSLQAIVKSIPGFSISGSASVNLQGEKKKLSESTEVHFYGDFVLDNTPSTFLEAIDAFKKLPGKNILLYYIFLIF